MKKVFKLIGEVLVDTAKTIALVLILSMITVRFICDCIILLLGSFIKAVNHDEQISDTLMELFNDYLEECEIQLFKF